MLLSTLRMLFPAILIFAQVGGPGTTTTGNKVKFNSQAEMKTIASEVGQRGDDSAGKQQNVYALDAIDAQTRPRLLQHGFTDAQITKIQELALGDVRRRKGESRSGVAAERGNVEKDQPDTSADIRIDPGEYKASVEDFGGIKINTDPEGAEVEIDDRRWDDPTDCSALTHSGTRTVRIKKAGYKPVSRTINVPAGDWASIEVTLEKEQP